MEKITFCGDDCLKCPRYRAKSDEELHRVAQLWHRVGWRSAVLPNEEIRCEGCSPEKQCTYRLAECTKSRRVEKCSQCAEFPCDKIKAMLERSKTYQEICRNVCTKEEYDALDGAFFHKEENLRK